MDTEQGKVFIGGISWETNEETLKEYFKAYGEVAETVIMRDRMTGRARGFGFIGFADPNVVERVLQDKHSIDGRQVELKRAVPREEQQRNAQMKGGNNNNIGMGGPRTKKIFVGGLAPSVTEDDFKTYFEQFGSITDTVVMYDHVSQRPRGFGFITFDSEDAVEKVVMKTYHQLHDKMVEVKRALPKEMSPGSARVRSSPVGGFGPPPNSTRYGAPQQAPAGRGGYFGGGAAVPGYFGGGYGAPAVNGGGYGAPPAAAAAPPAVYGGAPAGYAGGYGAAGYGNPTYVSAPGPYVSAPMAGGYAATVPGGGNAPWGSTMQQNPGGNVGYGYGSAGDATYSGGYGNATGGTGAYVAPTGAPGGGMSSGYQGGAPAGDVYGGTGYENPYNVASSGVVANSGYAMGGPVQADSGVNGSPGYGAASRQTQRVADARFRPYPTSGDRAS